jgi:copper(I)-binding protein
MSMDNGVMKMRPVKDGVEIKPGATVELKSGGYHLMMMDLKQPLKAGDHVKGTLTFEKAGPVDVEFAVEGVGGAPAAKSDSKPGMMKMDHMH